MLGIRTVLPETGSGGMPGIIAQKGGATQRGLLRADATARGAIAAVELLRLAFSEDRMEQWPRRVPQCQADTDRFALRWRRVGSHVYINGLHSSVGQTEAVRKGVQPKVSGRFGRKRIIRHCNCIHHCESAHQHGDPVLRDTHI